MRSIGARLTFWYALSATFSMALLFIAGYKMLEDRLIHGLDLLNDSEFSEIAAHLGPDYVTLSPEQLDARIRETTEVAKVLFYINVQTPQNRVLFSSSNLNGQSIPDVKGRSAYNYLMPGIGEIRVKEYVLLPPYDILIATPVTQVRDALEEYLQVGAGLLAAMLATSIVVGLGLSRYILRPLRLIRETASRIGSDNLSERIPVPDVEDEITDLVQLLNLMFDRIETAFNQVRRFASEASHELKTPLSLMRLHTEKLLGDESLGSEQSGALLELLEELLRLNLIIDELLFLSRAEAKAIQLQMTTQDPKVFLESFRSDAQELADHYGCHFECDHQGGAMVAFEAKWLRQVLFNLLSNALAVSPEGGKITLHSRVTEDGWRVLVEDEGPGLTAEQREQMFEPFVRYANRARAEDRGSGLGLSICRSLIALHSGTMRAEAGDNGRGLRVLFEIPRA